MTSCRQANVSLSSAISAICDAIDSGGAIARAATVPAADPPSQLPNIGDPSAPQRFLTEPASTCAKWVSSATTFEAELREWEQSTPRFPRPNGLPSSAPYRTEQPPSSVNTPPTSSNSAVAVEIPYLRTFRRWLRCTFGLFKCHGYLHRDRQLPHDAWSPIRELPSPMRAGRRWADVMTSIPKPSGGRKDEMTAPPAAWPQTDEDVLQRQADSLRAVQH